MPGSKAADLHINLRTKNGTQQKRRPILPGLLLHGGVPSLQASYAAPLQGASLKRKGSAQAQSLALMEQMPRALELTPRVRLEPMEPTPKVRLEPMELTPRAHLGLKEPTPQAPLVRMVPMVPMVLN